MTLSRVLLVLLLTAGAWAVTSAVAVPEAAASCTHQGRRVTCPPGVADGSHSLRFNNGGIVWSDGTTTPRSACCTPATANGPATGGPSTPPTTGPSTGPATGTPPGTTPATGGPPPGGTASPPPTPTTPGPTVSAPPGPGAGGDTRAQVALVGPPLSPPCPLPGGVLSDGVGGGGGGLVIPGGLVNLQCASAAAVPAGARAEGIPEILGDLIMQAVDRGIPKPGEGPPPTAVDQADVDQADAEQAPAVFPTPGDATPVDQVM
jgi:hypothetical protein